jgi:hypothetical protein
MTQALYAHINNKKKRKEITNVVKDMGERALVHYWFACKLVQAL